MDDSNNPTALMVNVTITNLAELQVLANSAVSQAEALKVTLNRIKDFQPQVQSTIGSNITK